MLEKEYQTHPKKPPNFSTRCVKLPWKPGQEKALLLHHAKNSVESPSLLPGMRERGPAVPELGSHPGLGLCWVVYGEREDPREAAEEGWRRGGQILLVPFFFFSFFF